MTDDQSNKPPATHGPRWHEINDRLKSTTTPKPIPEPIKREILGRLKSKRKDKSGSDNSEGLIAEAVEIMRKRDNSSRIMKELSGTNYPGGHSTQLEINKLNHQLGLIFDELSRLGVTREEALQAIKHRFDQENTAKKEIDPPRGSRR